MEKQVAARHPSHTVRFPVFCENHGTATHHRSNRRRVSCHPLARDLHTNARPDCRSQLPNFRSTCCDPGTARSEMRPVEIAQSNQPRTNDDDRQGRDLIPEAVIERPEENPFHSFSPASSQEAAATRASSHVASGRFTLVSARAPRYRRP